jgi:deazaflavin-dependent oxidoreductase (nitroreductase family)
MKDFNRKLISEFRSNGGQLSGPMAGRSLLLLTTTGARSGEARTTVLGYGRQGDRYIVIASNNGAPAHPAWYQNLLADPSAIVEVGPEKFGVKARTAAPRERDDLAAAVPYLAQQQGLIWRSSRASPAGRSRSSCSSQSVLNRPPPASPGDCGGRPELRKGQGWDGAGGASCSSKATSST